jgi:hypothetical protein
MHPTQENLLQARSPHSCTRPRTEAPESTPCPTLTTHPASLKALPLVLDTYEAAVRVCRGLSAQGV